MITRCDHCGSKFEVSGDLVYSKDPGVRCGECMSLFDARANLYDEGRAHNEAAAYKPVQQSRVTAATDPRELETADTVVSEHYYQSRGVSAGSSSDVSSQTETATAGTAMADGFYQAIDQSRGSQSGLEVSRSKSGHGEYSHTELSYAGQDHAKTNPLQAENGQGRYDNEYPDIDLSSPKSSPAYPDYRLNEGSATDLEFERTVATESALATAGIELPYQQDVGHAKPAKTTQQPYMISDGVTAPRTPTSKPAFDNLDISEEDRELLAAEEIRQLKRKAAGERERRALSIEPPRPGLDPEKMRQIEEFKARNVAAKKPQFVEKDLPQSAKPQDEYAFIPGDVLQKPAVYRDDRTRDEELRFEAETPHFDTSLRGRSEELGSDRPLNRSKGSTDGRYAADSRSVQVPSGNRVGSSPQQDNRHGEPPRDGRTRDAQRQDMQRRSDLPHEGQQRDVQQRESHSRVNRAPLPGRERPYRQNTVRRESPERRQVHESSAQEMRRYQQYRPAVAVSEPIDELTEAQARTVRAKRSGLSAWVVVFGSILIACLALFAARNVIANLNLPAPIISGFCQLTGCVPTEPQKDVSQLETMRKRIYSHPDIDNALVISVDLVNHSVYKQPYPAMAVILIDAEGDAVAERRFEPADYEVVDRREATHLMPEQPTRIKIEVVDTGLGATQVAIEYR